MAYATLQDIKEYLGITTTKDDTLLTRLLANAQRRVEQYCQKVFEVPTEVVDELTVYVASTKTFNANCPYIDKNYKHNFIVPYDLLGISAVSVDSTDVLANCVPYYTEQDSVIYKIVLDEDSTKVWADYTTSKLNSISITGYWAYSYTAPYDIAQATIELTAYHYQVKDRQVGGDAVSLPNGTTVKIVHGMPINVLEILNRYKRITLI